VPGLAGPQPLPEHDQRQRLFDAAAQAMLLTGPPLLLVADDMHWCDRETLQFLHYLLRVAPDARLLVTATARREELVAQHPLHELLAGLQLLERSVEIELGRLSRDETAALAERLAGRRLGEAEADQLYEETEGSPLFVVEALRAGWNVRDAGAEWTSPRVQAVIESRLGQLTESQRRAVEALTARIIDKLLHLPTVRMKQAAAGADGGVYAETVRHLFGLGEDER
jgi:predicted ATPase